MRCARARSRAARASRAARRAAHHFAHTPTPDRASHNEGFWPEMGAALAAHGAHNYSISLHPGTRQLFGFVEIEDEKKWAAIAESDVCKRWWAWMREFVAFNADGKPAATDLTEVFFFKGDAAAESAARSS